MAQLITDERQTAEELLAAADAATEPEVAPIRYDVRYKFSDFTVFTAGFLGVVAIAAGVICGIVFTNS